MWTLTEARSRVTDLATPALCYAELQALAALLRLHPRLRHHLVARHPAGLEAPFRAAFQFNVVATDTLRDAMKRPDEYRDLLVRISGYNVYFVELNRDMQLELIARTEHALAGPHAA